MAQSARRSFLTLFLLLATGFSHATVPNAFETPLPADIKGWSPDWLIGSTLRLMSETSVFDLSFGNSEWVALTAGEKGGPLTAPLLPWRIEKGKLFIGLPGQPSDVFEFVSITGNKLRVRTKGKEVTFEISRKMAASTVQQPSP